MLRSCPLACWPCQHQHLCPLPPEGLTTMLEYYSGNDEASSSNGGSSSSRSSWDSDSSWRSSSPSEPLLMPEDFRTTKALAVKHVRVPQNVIQLLADLRIFLQVGPDWAR